MSKQSEETKENQYIQRIENTIQQGKLDEFIKVYSETVFSYLTKHKHCLNASFSINREKNTFQSIYHWTDRDSFEQIGNPKINKELREIASKCKPFLTKQPQLSKWDVMISYHKQNQ